ncbi:MAG TPA: DUF167 domain-containing protein [Solirubrobacteraceae bacterium]|nr:DUF167 domain-containing protein [Solirubrobacteraceae bacterium]
MSDPASIIRLSVSAADEQALDTRIASLSAAFPAGTLVTVTRGTVFNRHGMPPSPAALLCATRPRRPPDARCWIARSDPRHDPGVELRVRVTARASRDELAGLRDGVLHVRVTAPPVDGKANQAVCRLIARAVGVGRTGVTVVRGERSRDKVVNIEGLEPEAVHRALR